MAPPKRESFPWEALSPSAWQPRAKSLAGLLLISGVGATILFDLAETTALPGKVANALADLVLLIVAGSLLFVWAYSLCLCGMMLSRLINDDMPAALMVMVAIGLTIVIILLWLDDGNRATYREATVGVLAAAFIALAFEPRSTLDFPDEEE